jgi:hypothetical protein
MLELPRPASLLAGALLASTLLAANRCYERKDYEPTPGLIEATLALSTAGGVTSLPADGISRLRLVAQISPAADLGNRTIAFSTTAGTLLGGTPGTGGEQEVQADSRGQASIELQSAQRVGDAVVTARVKQVAGLTRQILITFTAANPDEVIRFVAAPASAPADGATLTAFTVAVSSSLPLGTPVQFQTTAGAFAPEGTASVSRAADGSFQATAVLESPATLSTALVRATASQVTREATIEFRRALPDRITVATGGKFQVMANGTDSVTVTGTYLRDVGQVTAGTVATFRATDATGAAIGFFRDVTVVGANGQATAAFIAGTAAYRGRVTITVGTADGAVTGSAEIEVIDPS